MTKKLIKNLFSMSDTELEQMINGVSKIFESIGGEDARSYYNSIHNKYKNGELVKKCEKEYINGKCVKDENYNALDYNNKNNNKLPRKVTHKLLSKHGINEKNYVRKRSELLNEIEELKGKNDAMRSQIGEMTQYIDGLNDKIKKLEIEKAELQDIVNKVKNCF